MTTSEYLYRMRMPAQRWIPNGLFFSVCGNFILKAFVKDISHVKNRSVLCIFNELWSSCFTLEDYRKIIVAWFDDLVSFLDLHGQYFHSEFRITNMGAKTMPTSRGVRDLKSKYCVLDRVAKRKL